MIENAREAAGMLQVILSPFCVHEKKLKKISREIAHKSVRHAIYSSLLRGEWVTARNLGALEVPKK